MVETAKEGSIYGAIGRVGVEAFIVRGLDARFDGVKRVDKEIDGESCECASEQYVGVGVLEGHCTSAACARLQGFIEATSLVVNN